MVVLLPLLPLLAAADGIESVSETGRIRNETVPNITDLRNEVSQDAGPGVERTRRQTRGALWALCHLGDAAVPNPGEVFNCSEVLLPSDYLQACGRWQCRDPQVDHCFFSSFSRGHVVGDANATASNETTSLPLRRTFRWRPDLSVHEMPVDRHEETRPVPLSSCRWPLFPRRRRPKCYKDLVERQTKAAIKSPRPSTPARSCPAHSCCRRSQPFFMCDSDSGAYLSRIWRHFGDAMVSKLLPQTSQSGKWQHCADEGQICLCLGEVRFGLEMVMVNASEENVQLVQWASETLLAKNGLVFCTEETFGGQLVPNSSEVQRVCQCDAVSSRRSRPLVVPSNETRLISADNVSRSSARAMSEEGRFIRSQPYSDDFLNGVRYDYASMHAGARLVTHAKGLLHAKAVLSPDKSLYMLSPCETRSWFVISLLEDIFVEYVGLVTLELFASGYRHLQILGSNQYPTEVWRLLGEIESNATSNYELFDVGSRCQRLAEECWVRFLKIRVLSHHRMEDNSFCALTRFQVFGATATNYIAKERTAEDRRDRRVDPSLLDIARWHEDVARTAALPPNLGQNIEAHGEPVANAKDVVADESKEGNHRLTDLPLALLKDATTWLRSKVLHRPAVAPPEDDSNASAVAAETKAAETKPALSDMLVELNVSTPEGSTAGSGLASLEKLQATLDSLAEAAPTNKAKKDSSMPALVAINKELREMQESQVILQEHNKHVISCLNTMLALVVQLFTEQNAQMKTLEERTNVVPDVRPPWWAIDRYAKNGRECPGGQGDCPEPANEVPNIPGIPISSIPFWEQLQVLLYYPLDRILLLIISFWLFLSRVSSRTVRVFNTPEVEVHEVNSTPSRSKDRCRIYSAKKDREREDTNRTVSGASGRRLQRELQKELRSKSKDLGKYVEKSLEETQETHETRGTHFKHFEKSPSRRDASRVRRRSRSADRERSSSDSSREVQRRSQRTFEILCKQLPQTPPLHHRTRYEDFHSGDDRMQRALRRHLQREEAQGEGDSSPLHRGNTDTAPSSSDRDERDEAWISRVASELGEVPELPHFKAPARRAPKRYSSAARRHIVHLAARRPETTTNSPVTGPAESQ